MNILEIPVSGISANPGLPSHPDKSSDLLSGFDALLSSLISELQGQNQAGGLNLNSLAKPNLLLLMGVNQAPEASGISADGLKDLFAKLGDKLLELLTKLFAGSQTGDKKDGLQPILDDITNSLAKDGGNTNNVLIKLLANVKQKVSEGGSWDQLGKLAEGLSESIKLKIQLISHKTGHAESGQDVDMIKFKLLIGLLGLEGTNDGKAEGAVEGALPGASDTATMRLKEMLMETFHIKPEAANGQADTAPASPRRTTIGPGAAHAADGSGNDPKNTNLLTGSINTQDTKSEGADIQQAVGQAASAKDISEAATVRHEPANSTLTKEATVTQTAESQDASKNTDDSNGSTTGTSNSQPYGYAAESKTSFAAELAQKAPSTTGNQGLDAKPGVNNPDQFIKQIVEKFDVLISGTRSEARIQLKPKYLGELKIHLTVEGDAMKAVLNASTHEAKHILEANLASLKQSLEDQGLKIREFSVSVGNHRENRGEESGRQHRGRSVGSHGGTTIAGEIQDIKSRLSLGSEMAVNYLV